MSDELRAAAERLRDLPNWNGTQNIVRIFGEHYEWLLRFRDYVIEQHPADDATSLDEAWLKAVGFEPSYVEVCRQRPALRLKIDSEFSIFVEGGKAIIATRDTTDDYYGCQHELETAVRTRGDLRAICKVLGIELREVK